MDVSDIQKQLDMGAPIEHEHTKNQKLAVEIALQHLDEIPDYYTRLKKMEADAKREHKKFKDVKEMLNWGTKSESTDSLNYDWNTPVRERPDRYCPKCEKLEIRSECKYGPRYWDMFSLPAELITSKKEYNTIMPHPANEEKDYEYSMARSELSTIMNAARRLKKKMKGEGNIEAWVQSKITKAADYIDTAADYIDSGESKVNEDVTIEDANGNTFIQIIDIIKADRLVKEGKKMKGEDPCWKGYEMIGKKKKGGKEVPNCVPKEQKSFDSFMAEAKKSEMKCNSPKSEPVGDSLTGKSHVVKACEGGKEKLIRFGQRGVKGSPKKKGESDEYASRRHRFQTRHAKNIAKGKMSAAYWANKVKW